MRRVLGFVSVVLALMLGGANAPAQHPDVTNARLETRPAEAGLAEALRAATASAGAVWVGYAAPLVQGSDHHSCCYSNGGHAAGRCFLEGRNGGGISTHGQAPGPVELEAPRLFHVLFRAEGGAITRVRTFSRDCALDAGGLPFVWLTGVRPAESVGLLSGLVEQAERARGSEREGKKGEGALVALALHAGEEADRALAGFVAAGRNDKLREMAAFWLGASRGLSGFELLRKLAREDASDRFREKLTFAISVSRQPGATDELLRMARADSSARVRGQALFWLAQKAGKKAAEGITEAIRDDPETEVKKRAVFALSQLPKDEAVPLLIDVARNNRNPVVRKQAMFWLGQSKDPRALAFFEELLSR